jgi:hypothetical protein
MKRRITIWAIFFVALIAWTGLCYSQGQDSTYEDPHTKRMKIVNLPNGEEVCDLTGEWNALIENYGEWSEFGSYPNIIKMTLVGNSFRGFRLMDNGPGSPPNSMIIEIDSEKNGFKQVMLSEGTGPCPCSGKLSEDGNKIFLDLKNKARLTLIKK